MKILDILACILLLVGGLNWGLVGALDLNVVDAIFGAGTLLSRVIYIAVGLAAVYQLFQWKCSKDRCCK